MRDYSVISRAYDMLDRTYFAERGTNPREVIQASIPNASIQVLDLCCGTLSNTLSIAKKADLIRVTGVDLSKDMLEVARQKCMKANIKNVSLRCEDATNVKIESETFDYIIIGLVLHESPEILRQGILKEAYRLLKNDGKLLILEWEQEKSLIRKLKFLPLYITEALGCLSFNHFYRCDKESYFKQFHFSMKRKVHCNYSVVMEFEKYNAC